MYRKSLRKPPSSGENVDANLGSFVEEQMNHELEVPLSFEELNYALSKVNLKSSPGKDKINYEIIEHLKENFKRVLLDIFNDLLFEGKFPEEWKNYVLNFIPKKGNDDKVRPIALASCVLKLMEKLLNERL